MTLIELGELLVERAQEMNNPRLVELTELLLEEARDIQLDPNRKRHWWEEESVVG